ncbi:MAG: fasciclin domain-containing protein [Novosphingobium sp.]
MRYIPALSLLLALPACGQDAAAPDQAAAAKPGGKALAAAIADNSELKTLSDALASTGLSAVFDGKASYTVLAPTDGAFAALGDKGKALSDPEQKPALAAVLRDHIVPGTLTPEDIAKAIKASGGKPVKMRTVGEGTVSFAKDGEAITVTASDGSTAKLEGAAIAASNGVALPIDAVLKKV